MNTATAEHPIIAGAGLAKPVADRPAFEIIGGELLTLRAGVAVIVDGKRVEHPEGRIITLPAGIAPGADLVITADADGNPVASIATSLADCRAPNVIGGVHFAPGGAAPARAGGDSTPALDPHSLWDICFRPACPDPRGMVFVSGSRGGATVPPFWADKYLLAQDHLAGTSRLGATIADGRNKPQRIDGAGNYDNCNFHTVTELLAHHGKRVLALGEFFAAAYGVAEKTSAERRTETTVLDAPRTSAFGLIQATGQRWQWGHDDDPDQPRPSLFGGLWGDGVFAGPRYAVVDIWPGYSSGWFSARGRSDHLQPV